jgi:predicted membrane channel-forming protein YqfA (hemolysin III family)
VEFRVAILLGRLAATDCEAIHDGLLRQPVNAFTSLALLAAGVWILSRAGRRPRESRGGQVAFGVAMTAVAVGSFVLHGPSPGWAPWFHDVSNLTALFLVTVINVGLLLGWGVRARILVIAAGVGVLGLTLEGATTWTTAIAFVVAPAAGLSVLETIRRGFRPRPTSASRRTVAWLVAIVSIGLGGAAFLLGREGAPLCNPESVLQLHAVWHVLVAVAAAPFATVAFERIRSEDRRPVGWLSR